MLIYEEWFQIELKGHLRPGAVGQAPSVYSDTSTNLYVSLRVWLLADNL